IAAVAADHPDFHRIRNHILARGASFSVASQRLDALDEAFLADPEIDAVYLTLPNALHAEWTIKAAEAGKHILCEKPMATSLKEADEMIEAAARNRVKLMIAHVLHFLPEYAAVKKVLLKGDVGRAFSGCALRWLGEPYFPFSSAWDGWYSRPEMGGGATLSMQIHDIDFFRSLFGDAKEVYTVSRNFNHPGSGTDDFSVTTLFFDNGTIATCEAGFASPSPFTQQLDLLAEAGYITLRSGGLLTSIKGSGASPVKTFYKDGRVEEVAVEEVNGYCEEIRHFVSCVVKDETPKVSPYDSRETLRTVLACLESANRGRNVKVS
ncbi:MAG: Gfo/Idh/MocA family oxidoreductase, partial [Candidatus Bathyarchaeia archaeon]